MFLFMVGDGDSLLYPEVDHASNGISLNRLYIERIQIQYSVREDLFPVYRGQNPCVEEILIGCQQAFEGK